MEPAKLDLTGCKYPMELHKLLSAFLNRLTYESPAEAGRIGLEIWRCDSGLNEKWALIAHFFELYPAAASIFSIRMP